MLRTKNSKCFVLLISVLLSITTSSSVAQTEQETAEMKNIRAAVEFLKQKREETVENTKNILASLSEGARKLIGANSTFVVDSINGKMLVAYDRATDSTKVVLGLEGTVIGLYTTMHTFARPRTFYANIYRYAGGQTVSFDNRVLVGPGRWTTAYSRRVARYNHHLSWLDSVPASENVVKKTFRLSGRTVSVSILFAGAVVLLDGTLPEDNSARGIIPSIINYARAIAEYSGAWYDAAYTFNPSTHLDDGSLASYYLTDGFGKLLEMPTEQAMELIKQDQRLSNKVQNMKELIAAIESAPGA